MYRFILPFLLVTLFSCQEKDTFPTVEACHDHFRNINDDFVLEATEERYIGDVVWRSLYYWRESDSMVTFNFKGTYPELCELALEGTIVKEFVISFPGTTPSLAGDTVFFQGMDDQHFQGRSTVYFFEFVYDVVYPEYLASTDSTSWLYFEIKEEDGERYVEGSFYLELTKASGLPSPDGSPIPLDLVFSNAHFRARFIEG